MSGDLISRGELLYTVGQEWHDPKIDRLIREAPAVEVEPVASEDAKRYLKCEIERVAKRLEDKDEIVYNGELVGRGVARRLNERHISFCKMVLSLLGEEVADA